MMVLVAFSIILITQPRISTFDPTLAFADAQEPLLSLTERVLADVSWTGSGAGTFKALVPIYKDAGEVVDGRGPTLVAAMAVELGRPALCMILGIAAVGIFLLSRAALVRVRNWIYPAAGASCLCTATLLAFSNAGLAATPSLIVLASTLGMAFGQSQRRSTPQLSELSDLVDTFTLNRNGISGGSLGTPKSSGL
jgi:hypothetical protein